MAARLRGGELSEEALHVAAYLGDEASRAVVGTPESDCDMKERLRKVVRGGFRTGPGRVASVGDRALLEGLARDCVERLLPAFGRRGDELRVGLDHLAGGRVEQALAVLGEVRGEVRSGEEWPALYSLFESAAAVHLAPTERRRACGVLEVTGSCARALRCLGAEPDSPWLARRLVARILKRPLPEAPVPSNPGRSATSPVGFAVAPHVIAMLAAFPTPWRAALWGTLERFVEGDESAALPVAGTNGPWRQLPIAPRSTLLTRLRLMAPQAVAYLLFRPTLGERLELCDLSPYPWSAVREEPYADAMRAYEYEFAASGDRELPEHYVDACLYLRPPYDRLDFGTRVGFADLRGAVESLAVTLTTPDELTSFEEQVPDRRDSRHAAVLPELRERSVPLLAQREQPQDGQLVEGECPRCSAAGELRVIESHQLAVCFRCYFDWW
ncbi:MAG TPA: hypothetical protein DEA08_25215 [Planctomycetes bacterium]|nr:hypothetical protein [Planctomycetota bacterium]